MGDVNQVPHGTRLEAIGTVKAVTGTAKAIDTAGVERQLQPGDKVYPNETIVTADGGVVLIEFLNGTHLDLPPASQIVLDGEILELARAQSEPLTVEQIQEMIARGEDPAAIAEATAAGAAAGDEGGSSFVVVDFNNTQGNVTSGFNTLGIPTPAFPILEAELPPEDDDGGAPPPSLPGDNGVGIVIPGALTVNEANLANGSDPDSTALTQPGTFTISASDGVNELAIEGQAIISNGVFTPISLVTASGNTIAITDYNPATGTISYTYTLNDNEAHPAGNGTNVLSENLSVELTDTDGDTASGSLVINIIDDVPAVVNDAKTVSEAQLTDLNIGFVLDFSTSINNTELNLMVDAVKAAAQDIFAMNPEGTTVSLVIFSATSLTYGPYTSYEEFRDQLNALNPIDGGQRPLGPGTDFTDAIQATMAFYEPVQGANNQIFFLSDGNPNQQLGTGGNALLDATSAAWGEFLNSNGINIATIGIGDNIKLERLQDVDLDGEGEPILVDFFRDLLETLPPIVQPGITGNVIARDDVNSGANNDTYGADGGRLLSIQVNTAAGLTTYTWDGDNTITLGGAQSGTISGDVLTVMTQLGGKFTFYFDSSGANSAGKWVYDPPQNVDSTTDEVFTYQVIDGDGDIAGGSLTVTVTDNATLSAQNSAAEPSLALMSAEAAEAGGNNWLSALALRGNVLGANAAPGDVVAFANLLAVTAAGIDIAGLHGILHLESSGDYVYTPYDPDIAPGTIENFSYTVQHSGGNTTTSSFQLEVVGNPDGGLSGNVIQGGTGADILNGLEGDDLLLGDAGDDTLNGGVGLDRLVGASGTDHLNGNEGADLLEGGSGDDTLEGGEGDDILIGNSGNDILVGGDGNDVLIGATGDDLLTGETGSDVFLWKAGETGRDVIRDFTQGEGGDVLHLADILQDEHANADSLGSYLSFAFDGQNTSLIIDVDGAGAGTATQTVVLEGVDLTANNTLTNAAIITNLLADQNLRVDP